MRQVFLLANGQHHETIDREKLGFKLSGLLMKGSAQKIWNGGDAPIKARKHPLPKLPKIRLCKAMIHANNLPYRKSFVNTIAP